MTTSPADVRALADAERAVNNLNAWIPVDLQTADDKRVRAACVVVKHVATFVKGPFAEAEDVHDKIRTALCGDKDYTDAFALIKIATAELRNHLSAIRTRPRNKTLVEKLPKLTDDLRLSAELALDAFVQVLDHLAGKEITGPERVTALVLETRVRDGLRTDQLISAQDQEAQRKKAAEDTLKELGDHYKDYAAKENSQANLLRAAAIAVLAGIAGIAFWVNSTSHELTVGAELLRLSVTLPLAVLVAYLSAESSRHRRFARWADELDIHMRSVSSYADLLGEKGTELLREFGTKIFGGTAADGPEPTDEQNAYAAVRSLLDLLVSLLDRRENR